MIDLEFVESLIRALDDSSLDSLELERGGTRIRLSKSPVAYNTNGATVQTAPEGQPAADQPAGPSLEEDLSPVPEASPPPPKDDVAGNLIEVTSPMVGTFYRAPSPDAPPYVEVGSRVDEGGVLCIIEAMKLMNELESEVTGTIEKILVDNAEPVEYGQVLFLVDPS
jgi:acetyl-CoA carboxylase biotin carboxyl carrier protein